MYKKGSKKLSLASLIVPVLYPTNPCYIRKDEKRIQVITTVKKTFIKIVSVLYPTKLWSHFKTKIGLKRYVLEKEWMKKSIQL